MTLARSLFAGRRRRLRRTPSRAEGPRRVRRREVPSITAAKREIERRCKVGKYHTRRNTWEEREETRPTIHESNDHSSSVRTESCYTSNVDSKQVEYLRNSRAEESSKLLARTESPKKKRRISTYLTLSSSSTFSLLPPQSLLEEQHSELNFDGFRHS